MSSNEKKIGTAKKSTNNKTAWPPWPGHLVHPSSCNAIAWPRVLLVNRSSVLGVGGRREALGPPVHPSFSLPEQEKRRSCSPSIVNSASQPHAASSYLLAASTGHSSCRRCGKKPWCVSSTPGALPSTCSSRESKNADQKGFSCDNILGLSCFRQEEPLVMIWDKN